MGLLMVLWDYWWSCGTIGGLVGLLVVLWDY